MKIELCFLVTVTSVVLSSRTDKLLRSLASFEQESISCMPSDGVPHMVPLLNAIARRYFKRHTTVILYDDYFYYHARLKNMLDKVLLNYAYPHRHGRINTTLAKPVLPRGILNAQQNEQIAYIVFTKEATTGAEVIREQTYGGTYAILIAQVSVYQVKTFLQTKLAADIINLLVLVDPIIKIDHFKQRGSKVLKECDVLIFSHEIVTDSLGSSQPVIVTAWRYDRFTQQVPLFTRKFKEGLGGLHLVVAASEIPPFVFRKQGQDSGAGYSVTTWEGIEVRLMHLVSSMLNFTVEFKEPVTNEQDDVAQLVIKDVLSKKADLAVGGVYLTADRVDGLTFSIPHTQDCASYISLASTALPKYRAIMGPFLWDVWLALTAVYILAMFPIAFSVWHSLKPLFNDIREVENMFWYVFGTFTNCFTFSGSNSWSKSDKMATKLFIGTYWVFTIIITACYTGSIVAFITLPVFPETIDSSKQLVEEEYKVGVLNNGGWERLYNESDDPVAQRLYKNVDLVPDLISGLKNVTKNVHERHQSAFLGSRRLLEYTVRTNFTPDEDSKRLLFHLSNECFVPLLVSFVLQKRTHYLEELNSALERALQAGFMSKVTREVEWEVYRSATGKLLRAHRGLRGVPEDRELTLDDTQGMFLLLGAGFGLAALVLTIEIIIWASEELKQKNFGERTLKEQIIDKVKEHWENLYRCLLAPVNSGVVYLRGRRVSSAFGEYVTRPYSSAWSMTKIPSPTVQSASPPPPNGIATPVPSFSPYHASCTSANYLHAPQENSIGTMNI